MSAINILLVWRNDLEQTLTGLFVQRRRTVFVLMCCISLALLTSSSATSAKAPAQDPLREKLDFLKEKLERYLSHSFKPEESDETGHIRFEAVSFETCKISWKISTEFSDSSEMPVRLRNLQMVNDVTVNLASIDAARTKIYVMEDLKKRNVPWSLALELKIRPGTPGFTQRMFAKGVQVVRMSTQARQSLFLFNLRDQRIAEQVSQVFADASNLCRYRPQRRR
jgi:hypothetical protein